MEADRPPLASTNAASLLRILGGGRSQEEPGGARRSQEELSRLEHLVSPQNVVLLGDAAHTA
jgi:hypothetical protein